MPEHQTDSRGRTGAITLIVLALGFLTSQSVLAIDYQIEIVLFENNSQSGQYRAPELYHPKTSESLTLNGNAALDAGFISIDSDLSLLEQAQSLDNSRGYRVLKHFAWRQPGLDDASAKSILISAGRSFKHYIPSNSREFEWFIPSTVTPDPGRSDRSVNSTEINGTIKIRLGRFLHLDAHLVFTDIENAHSFRLNHSRKMRSRELHYIDNPRFGFLARILPIEE